MDQKSALTELIEKGPETFHETLLTLAVDSPFERLGSKDESTAALGETLLTRYLHWRTENGVRVDFESDIKFLLGNERVRSQLVAALFEHGVAGLSQLEAVLDLLVLASYSRQITVNQTFKRKPEGAAPRPPGIFQGISSDQSA